MSIAHPLILFLARFLLVFYFLKAGVNNYSNFNRLTKVLRQRGFFYPELIMTVVIATQLIGGLFVVFNFYAVYAAVALIFFTLAANFCFCNYWVMEGLERRNVGFLFYANLSVIGGLLLVVSGYFK